MTDTQTDTVETPAATATRDFVMRAAKAAKEQAATFNRGAEKTTAVLESAIASSATTVADAARAMQSAIYRDVEAAIANVEKLAASRSLAEAAQLHVEFLSQRSQVSLERFKSATDYMAKAMQSASKTASENIAKMSERPGEAA